MQEARGALEDERVAHVDGPGVAVRLHAGPARDGGLGPDEVAQGQRRLRALGVEVAEGHCAI